MAQTRLKVGVFEAWAVVENEEVEHYHIDVNEEEKLATCWIASTAGKKFGVFVVNRHGEIDSRAYIYLDGYRMHAVTLLKHNKEPRLMDHVAVGECSIRPFLFGALNLTEDETLSTQTHEELGTIKVVIRRITNYWKQITAAQSVRLREDVKIHESAKKLATHQVLFGETQINRGRVNGKAHCERKEIVATFTFHYRSLDMLKALDIVPCDPSPTKTENPSEPGTISGKRKAESVIDLEEEGDEEKPVVEINDAEERKVAQLEVTLRSCNAELEKIRQARLDRQQGKHAKKKVKCESKPVFLPGEIIDLTI